MRKAARAIFLRRGLPQVPQLLGQQRPPSKLLPEEPCLRARESAVQIGLGPRGSGLVRRRRRHLLHHFLRVLFLLLSVVLKIFLFLFLFLIPAAEAN